MNFLYFYLYGKKITAIIMVLMAMIASVIMIMFLTKARLIKSFFIYIDN